MTGNGTKPSGDDILRQVIADRDRAVAAHDEVARELNKHIVLVVLLLAEVNRRTEVLAEVAGAAEAFKRGKPGTIVQARELSATFAGLGERAAAVIANHAGETIRDGIEASLESVGALGPMPKYNVRAEGKFLALRIAPFPEQPKATEVERPAERRIILPGDRGYH